MNENGMVTLQIPTRSTDPEEVKAIAEALMASLYETPPVEAFGSIEPEPVEERKPARPAVRLPFPPIHTRLRLWLIAQVSTPYRCKRTALWLLRFPPRAWSLLRVITSGHENPHEKADRDRICGECPFRTYRMRRTKQGVIMDEHCGKCGCPDWKLSRNAVRNWYSGWQCPERRHAGPYRDDDLRAALEANGYDPKMVFAGGGGCTGCGCGKAANQTRGA